MPVSITKNQVSQAQIRQMAGRAFPGEAVREIAELTEGYFNVAFRVELEDRTVILKIAPPAEAAVMTHEKNIMRSEVEAMRLVAGQGIVPVPEVLYYDDSHELCGSDYFFMEFLEGKSFSSVMEEMSGAEQEPVYFQMGKYTRAINGITNDRFGYFGQEEKQGGTWFPVFRSMIEDTFADGRRKQIGLPVAEERLLAMLEEDREIFEAVRTPRLVHWDIWAGNVFVKNGTVTGIIDFERCLWADELMEVGFRTSGYEESFYRGYGMELLSPEQKQRAKWYDVYLYLINCLECDYRMYETRDMYRWACGMLERSVRELERV